MAEKTKYAVLLVLPDERFADGRHTYLGEELPAEDDVITVETGVEGAEHTTCQARVIAVVPEAEFPIRAAMLEV